MKWSLSFVVSWVHVDTQLLEEYYGKGSVVISGRVKRSLTKLISLVKFCTIFIKQLKIITFQLKTSKMSRSGLISGSSSLTEPKRYVISYSDFVNIVFHCALSVKFDHILEDFYLRILNAFMNNVLTLI